ncbi:FAD-dependent monooxygenase OpS4 [Paramyrothecium foliicola]|nr:FAD-dependent monooxygenase OpS4 [Paramyrothecium foliicola]
MNPGPLGLLQMPTSSYSGFLPVLLGDQAILQDATANLQKGGNGTKGLKYFQTSLADDKYPEGQAKHAIKLETTNKSFSQVFPIMDANGYGEAASNGIASESPSSALRITIIGAGIGGLTAAIYLRRQGHNVILLEQSRFANEVGAAMHLAPNANGLLRRVGIFPEHIGANIFRRVTEFTAKNEVLRDINIEESNKIWQHPWHLIHRVRLHEELKMRATSAEGPGVPADLRLCSRVIDVDIASATVTLENGDKIKGDLVIGADGVHSKTRNKVLNREIKPFSSGKSAFRFLVPRKIALADAETAKFAKDHGQLIIWYGTDRRVVMYPCENNDQLNFICIHPHGASESVTIDGTCSTLTPRVVAMITKMESTDWSTDASTATLLKVYEGFHPALLALLQKANPDSLKIWELLDMEALPIWTRGHVALLGDAAHPFLPHQGQGAAVAIEDAVALAVVLPQGTTIEDIPERLQLYQDIRYKRAHRIQEYSRQAGRDVKDKDFDMLEYGNYNMGHDEWDNSIHVFRKWNWAKKPNLYWRMPISFGPFPGPRQTFEGKARVGTHSTFTTASLTFKTSRTVLQNLFPSASFRFKGPGTVAYASISQTTLNKMEWLGGSGYRHIGLYIHGVQYTQADGKVLDGTFLPVLFESLTDPIVSGREELGMPKLYCSIDIWRRSSSYRVQTGWQGVQFGSLTLEGLTEADPSISKGTIGGVDDDGIFAYKYIPKVGERGQADVEHATFVPHAEEAQVVSTKVQKVFTTEKGDIRFDPHDWEALPTLHHVVLRLAEIPIYEVISGKVVEGLGVPDVSSARRID